MTVDVEEYFQVSAFNGVLERSQWSALESRVELTVDRVLACFAECDVKATFFILGCVAEAAPAMVRRIAAAGHEVASHGWQHIKVSTQTPDEFLADARRTRLFLEDVSGLPVRGYRAASFSIGAGNLWAYDVLANAGYRYSSSIYPVHHDHYGFPSAPRHPFRLVAGGVLEIPPATLRLVGHNLPMGGGGYFRLLPLSLSRWALRRINAEDAMPAVFYFHPWEMDAEQPRVDGIPLARRFRHYVNLDSFPRKLSDLLKAIAWGRMDRIYGMDTP